MGEVAAKVVSEPRSWFRGPRSAAIWLGAYFLFQTLATLRQLPQDSPRWLIEVARFVTVGGYMFLALAMLASLAGYLKTMHRAASVLVLGAVLWLGLNAWFGARDPERVIVAGSAGPPQRYRLPPGAAISLGGGAGAESNRRYPIPGTAGAIATLRRSKSGFQIEPSEQSASGASVTVKGASLKGPSAIAPGDAIQIRLSAAAPSSEPREVRLAFGFPLRHPFPPQRWLQALFLNLMDIGLALAAAGIGALIAAVIRDPNILLPASVFAAFADYLMVYTSIGIVHTKLQTEQGRQQIGAMSAHVPTPHPAIAPLTVGMADYVFLAFFFACVYRFGMNERGTFAAFFLALTLSLLFVAYVSAIPALAPMALAFVAVNFRHFRLSKSELQAMGLAFAIVAAVVAGLFFFRGH